jgi:CRISPR system Cascade subunit CasA
MNKAFNLLDERWLPVRSNDGELRNVGLLEFFEQVGNTNALAETSPPSLIAMYRLLLAITHRALTLDRGTWKESDRVRWYREGLPQEALRDYLDHWRERFWLFHPEQPFMQVAALATAEETRDTLKPWTQISLASANGNGPVVFDHSYDDAPTAVTPSEAIRTLLGFLQFTPGGLVRTIRGSDKAGPLANTAAVLPIGSTLNETLCLSLHPSPITDIDDLAAWEHPPVELANLRADPSLATGANDRYTRLSRAALLQPEDDGSIQWIHFAAGIAMGDDINSPDPMASYRAGTNALVRLTFREGRAFWRDLPALVPDAEGKAAHPAAVLGWAANLRRALGELNVEQRVLVAGLASDQAKLLRWRLEQIALPTTLLTDAGKAESLRDEVRRAEELYSQLRRIATSMIAATMPDPGNKDTHARARDVLDAGPAASTFFADAERKLLRVMKRIADGKIDDGYQEWSETLTKAAESTWEVLRRSLGHSPAALRAEAKAYPRFRALLSKLQPQTSDTAVSREAQS